MRRRREGTALTPELSYLRALVREYVSGGPAAEPAPGIDWQALDGLLVTHRITPTVAPLILMGPAPEEVKRRLEEQARAYRRRASYLMLEMQRLLEVLSAAGIEALPLKGFALGMTVYRRAEERFLADLDILVRRDALEPALETLSREKLRPVDNRPHPTFYRDHHFHWQLASPAGVVVELHWGLSKPSDPYGLDPEGFFGRARAAEWDGATLQVPSDTDQLLHAANQAVLGGFADARRLVDAAMLLRAGVAADPRLADLARRQGLATSLWTLLELTADWTGSEAPRELEAALRPDPFVVRCLGSLPLGELELGRRWGPRFLLRWLCAPDLRDAGSAVRQFLFPGLDHWLALGYEPGQRPGLAHRAAGVAGRCWSAAKVAAYQYGRLVRSLAEGGGVGARRRHE